MINSLLNLAIENKKKISLSLLCLCLCFPLLPFNISTILIVVFLVWEVICNKDNFIKNYNERGLQKLIEQILFFVLLIVSIIYSNNKSLGLNEITTGLPIILIPFVLFYFTSEIKQKQLDVILRVFAYVNVLFVCYLYVFSTNKLSLYPKYKLEDVNYLFRLFDVLQLPFGEINSYALNTNENSFPIFFHKGYNSMYLLFSVFILGRELYKSIFQKKITKSFIFFSLISFLSYILFKWFSLPNLLAFISIIGLFTIIKYKKSFYIYLLILVVSLFAINLPTVQNKINNNYTLKTNLRQVKAFLSSPFTKTVERDAARVTVYSCSIELISKAPLMGYGIGNTQEVLNNCYKTNNYKTPLRNKLNTHNYYFHLWLSGGFLCLLSLLYLMFKRLFFALKRGQFLYIALLVLLMLNMLTENLLYRSYGVFFFAIFLALFEIRKKYN